MYNLNNLSRKSRYFRNLDFHGTLVLFHWKLMTMKINDALFWLCWYDWFFGGNENFFFQKLLLYICMLLWNHGCFNPIHVPVPPQVGFLCSLVPIFVLLIYNSAVIHVYTVVSHTALMSSNFSLDMKNSWYFWNLVMKYCKFRNTCIIANPCWLSKMQVFIHGIPFYV